MDPSAKAKHFPEWEKMTVREVRAYLEERQSVIVPLGVTEQHGYHLPLGTDAIIGRELGKRVGARCGMLVAPTLNMSFSGGQLPGTINLNPNTMAIMVADVLRSLAVQGFRNLFLLPCHGGSENFGSLDNALKLLLRDDPSFRQVMIVLAPVWKASKGWQDALAEGDWHAGWLETSMMMELAPELVQMEHLETDAPEFVKRMREHPDNYQRAQKPADHEMVVPRMEQRPEMRVGVMGAPEQATPERGRDIIEDTVNRLGDLFTQLERDRSRDYKEVNWTPAPIILG